MSIKLVQINKNSKTPIEKQNHAEKEIQIANKYDWSSLFSDSTFMNLLIC